MYTVKAIKEHLSSQSLLENHLGSNFFSMKVLKSVATLREAK